VGHGRQGGTSNHTLPGIVRLQRASQVQQVDFDSQDELQEHALYSDDDLPVEC
jgi:hypothetical protein